MAEADAEREGLLAQRTFGPLHRLGDLGHGSLGFRVLLQQLDIGRRIRLTCELLRCLLCCLGHMILLLMGDRN